MIQNCTFTEMAGILAGASSVLIFPHQNVDGDGLGSSVALCRQLRLMGKESAVVLNDAEVAGNLKFLERGLTVYYPDVKYEAEVCMAVDSCQGSRFPESAPLYRRGRVKLAVDHHLVMQPEADYYIVDPVAAAAAELVLELIKALGRAPDAETAEALFAAITTDTGNFQYANTTSRTHLAAAELCETGFSANHVSNLLYRNERSEKIALTGLSLSRLEISAGGKLATAYVSSEDLQKTGAVMSDSDGIVSELRSIAGVEVAVLVKEDTDGIRVSFRSKENFDVQKIAASFGGGGHLRAAGATLHMSLSRAIKEVTERTAEALCETNGAGE